MPYFARFQAKFDALQAQITALTDQIAALSGGRATPYLYSGMDDRSGAVVGDYYIDTNNKVLSRKVSDTSWNTVGFLSRNNFVWQTGNGAPGTGESASLHPGDYYLNADDGHIWWYSWLTGQWEDTSTLGNGG